MPITTGEVTSGLGLLAVALEGIEVVASAAKSSGAAGAANTATGLVPALLQGVGASLSGGASSTVNTLSGDAAAIQAIITSIGNLLNVHAANQPAPTPTPAPGTASGTGTGGAGAGQ
jgi:hypothetical protein